MKKCCCLDLSNDILQDCFQNVSLNGNYVVGDILFLWDEDVIKASGTVVIQIETGSVVFVINSTAYLIESQETLAITANPLTLVGVIAFDPGVIEGKVSVIVNHEA